MTAGTVGLINLQNPVSTSFAGFIIENGKHCVHTAKPDSCTGRTVVICGAGPSLRDAAPKWCGPDVDLATTDIWGCNSAAIWLTEQGYQVTHGFTIDQTPEMCTEWASVPAIKYWVASTINPALTAQLLNAGRELWWFHNHVGLQPPQLEMMLYAHCFPSTCKVGDGLNSVNRAGCLAEFLGYSRIVILGADCALGKDDEMHANGDGPTAHGATPVILEGEIDGRQWRTKPDMIISAVSLVRRARADHRYVIVGDTLPNVLMEKSEEFLAQLPSLTSQEEGARLLAEKREKELAAAG